MSMTERDTPRFLQRWRKREPGPNFVNRDQDVIRNVARDIAMKHPHHTQPKPFTEQLREFGEGADALMRRLAETTEELRTALAENAVLRARNEDLEAHIDDQADNWERQYEAVNAERQRLTRLYYALISRFDGAVDFLINARESAKKEAFAPDETVERTRENPDRAKPRGEAAVQAIEDALRGNPPLPQERPQGGAQALQRSEFAPNYHGQGYGDNHQHRRRDLDLPRDE